MSVLRKWICNFEKTQIVGHSKPRQCKFLSLHTVRLEIWRKGLKVCGGPYPAPICQCELMVGWEVLPYWAGLENVPRQLKSHIVAIISQQWIIIGRSTFVRVGVGCLEPDMSKYDVIAFSCIVGYNIRLRVSGYSWLVIYLATPDVNKEAWCASLHSPLLGASPACHSSCMWSSMYSTCSFSLFSLFFDVFAWCHACICTWL